MRVIPIRSRMLFKDFSPRAQETVPEGARFFAGAALTFWAPTLMYCYVIGQALPFYLMVCNEALGVLCGLFLYKKTRGGIPSCVPVTHRPDVASVVHGRGIKKVA